MCAGAIVLSGFPGSSSPPGTRRRASPARSGTSAAIPGLNHRVHVTEGILAEACGEVLKAFFREKRLASRQRRSAP